MEAHGLKRRVAVESAPASAGTHYDSATRPRGMPRDSGASLVSLSANLGIMGGGQVIVKMEMKIVLR